MKKTREAGNTGSTAAGREGEIARLMESSPDELIRVDEKGTILLLNRVAAMECSAAKAVGASIGEAYPDRRRGSLLRDIASHALKTEAETDFDLVLPSKKGERDFFIRAIPERDLAGHCVTALLALHDQTEHKSAEEEQARGLRLESLGLLAGGIAHEFNNIIGGLFGYVEIALDACESQEPQKAVAWLKKAIAIHERARAMSDRLLTFSRGGSPIRKEENIADLVREIVAEKASTQGLAASYSLEPELGRCLADRRQIALALGNIMENASQAMPAGESLSVDARRSPDGAFVEIRIADTGEGIAADDLGKIFDPFFSTRDGREGMGLPVAHSIVKRHGGSIAVESTLGKGTVFIVRLPVVRGEAKEEPKSRGPSRRAKGRLLVADPDEGARSLLKSMAAERGWEATGAESALEAVEAAAREALAGRPYNAAIVNITLCDSMKRRQLVDRLKAVTPGMRTMAAAIFAEDPVLMDPGSCGFDAALLKPYREDAIEDLLFVAIRSPKAPTKAP